MAAESKKLMNLDKLAKMIASGFDQTASDLNKTNGRIDLLQDELKTDIHRVEAKVDKALHAEYFNLESRIKRIEQKIGIK